MARFIIFHTGPQDVSQDVVVEAARAVMCSLPNDVKWLNSWYVPSENRLICEWEAADEKTVRSALKEVMALWPIELMHEVVHIEPDWYK